jgi:predicted MFS family arabinose efflux permease
VTLGIFSLMTSQLLPVGLLTPVAATPQVPAGNAGPMVSVPGLVAAISASSTIVVAGGRDRRLALCVLIALMGLANLASAIAPSIAVVLAARILIGVSVGGFWAIAGGLALRLVPEEQVARASELIFAGVSAASVLGVPLETMTGEIGGRRSAFAAVGGFAVAALIGLVVLVTRVPATRTITLAELPRLLRRNSTARIGVIVTFLLVTGHFVAYTFVRPVPQDLGGFPGLRPCRAPHPARPGR